MELHRSRWCVNGDAALFDALLGASTDPNTASPEGETALMTAARTGVPGAITALLARGADVNAKESTRGQTALMWAAGEGHAAAIKTLIAGGADINLRSAGGWTALLFAVREGQTGAVQALLDAGASVNDAQEPPAPSTRRSTTAANSGGAGAAAARPAGGPSALVLAVGSNHYELAAYLLDRGADPNAAAHGWTALHQITWMRKPVRAATTGPAGSGDMDGFELVRRLAAHGADLDARMTRRHR